MTTNTKPILAIKERPILFSGEMVNAILKGRKWQTRRVLKSQPILCDTTMTPRFKVNDCLCETYEGNLGPCFKFERGSSIRCVYCDHEDLCHELIKYTYGKVGGRLWIKETFYALGEWLEISAGSNKFTFYRHHEKERPSIPLPVKFLDNPPKKIETGKIPGIIGWYKRPSIFLPRKDSRINLEITDIRVERVQDISQNDCYSEGVVCSNENHQEKWIGCEGIKGEFAKLWNQINEKQGFGWEKNPWVWCLTFKVV